MKRFGLGGPPPPAAAGASDPPTKESQQLHDLLIDDSEAGRRGSSTANNNHNDPGATLLLFKNDTDDSDKRFLLPPTLLLFFKACLGVFGLTLLYIMSTSIWSSISSSSSSPAPLVLSPAVADACADKWRPDVLVGKCFGLEEAVDPTASKSPEACRAQCCGDEKCVTWQYQQTRGCFVGGPIRLGLERADTPHWCEESAQAPWTGRRLLSRTAGEGGEGEGEKAAAATCTFSTTEELIYQCFGLGPERVDAQGERLTSAAACQQYCCGDKECKTWQFRQDKGCFAGSEGHCEEDNNPYIGGRKCVEGFC